MAGHHDAARVEVVFVRIAVEPGQRAQLLQRDIGQGRVRRQRVVEQRDIDAGAGVGRRNE